MMAVQAQVSPVITERRNSMITKTCACIATGIYNRAYVRDLLDTAHPV
jgi:queuine/archaeosine tRNA-ribosyltransferase